MEDQLKELTNIDGVKNVAQTVIETTTQYGLSAIGAIFILVVGLYISGVVRRSIYKGLSKPGKIDEMLCRFLSSLAKYAVMLFTFVAVLSQFGIQTASLVAVLGAAGLAIGLALQGTLAHVASGVMLLVFRPFKIGDFVDVAGYAGTVHEVGLFMTELKTPDNVHIMIPNGKVWESSIKNFSYNDTRRVDIPVGIAYEDDATKALEVIKARLAQDERILTTEDVTVAVGELGESSVNLVVRMWCNKADYWSLKWDMTKAIKETLDKEGITIPYPQRVMHMVTPKEKA